MAYRVALNMDGASCGGGEALVDLHTKIGLGLDTQSNRSCAHWT